MAATAEYAVCDAISRYWRTNSTGLSAGEYVCEALRSAGWLRSSPWVESASEERIATLTRERDEAERNTAQAIGQLDKVQRERDEALKGREYWLAENKKLTQHYDGALERLRASAASPEVMRLVKAVQEYKEEVGDFSAASSATVWGRLALAVNTLPLSASRQPKAQEQSAEYQIWAVVGPDGIRATWDRMRDGETPEQCARKAAFGYGEGYRAVHLVDAARLNGEGGAK